ncbi:Hypothetical predicted protein [Olea europaea subsp. europaea]|nr:Hypothetical predicted protein [Olea europaea subsp. europaea]
MFILLSEVKKQIPSVSAVSSGAIASDYQRLRVESVCSRLGLVSLAYLWKQDQSYLLQQMISCGIVAIIVKVASIGLHPSKHLGKEIEHLESHLHKLKELYGVNVCGEGGEYETLTLDCPLFKNARIVLDKFQVVLHSSDHIAPVGVLHPLAFHLEKKLDSASPSDIGGSNEVTVEEMDSVYEVSGDWTNLGEAPIRKVGLISNLKPDINQRLRISKSKKDGTFSISCWLQDACNTSGDLREDLEAVLMKIELLLVEYNCSWENVLYIHLYVANMNDFSVANETYVKFITQEKCRYGVPSRSTIELPLMQVGLGRAYVEVLVSDGHTKNVLHVQSISCWAPSCIGPYSQATLHKDVLYMAGQLGLDPPTMLLCNRGPAFELQRALEHCEAVAKCFNCSISTCALLLVIYCSESLNKSDCVAIDHQRDEFLAPVKVCLDSGSRSDMCEVLRPTILCVLVPDLPKRASVEIKPILYTGENVDTPTDVIKQELSIGQTFWGFHHEKWHDSCIQKCIVYGRICSAVVSVTQEIAAKICYEIKNAAYDPQSRVVSEAGIGRIAEFCIYVIDQVLIENIFSWGDVLTLRIYYSTSLQISYETLSTIFNRAFNEFGQMSSRVDIDKGPFFNLVPVLGSGRTATLMDDILTCELYAQKF